jgi:hypothetical protein
MVSMRVAIRLAGALILGLAALSCERMPGRSCDSDAKPPEQPAKAKQSAAGARPTATPSSIEISADHPIAAEDSLEVIRKHVASREGETQEPAKPRPTVSIAANGDVMWAGSLGLMWTLKAEGLFSHDDAVAYCHALARGGHDDWRLPTIGELAKVMATGFEPASRSRSEVLWSSTAKEARGMEAWDRRSGEPAVSQINRAHALCVRTLG